MMRAFLTGGTGFIGSHLRRRLLRDGWQVHLILPSFEKPPAEPEAGTSYAVHDGTTESLVEMVKATKPDVVFHLASYVLPQHTPGDVAKLMQANVTFPTQLLEAMQQAGVTRIINTGTFWQHYQNSAYSPTCLYAATKQAFETMAQFYLETTPIRMITLKLFDTYGPGDPRPKLLTLLKKIADSGESLDMSAGEQMTDLVHTDDIIEAYVIAAARLMRGEVTGHETYAVSSGKPLRLRDFVLQVEGILGKKLNINWGKRPYRPREVMVPWNTGAKLPGWEPKVTLKAGLQRL